MGYYLYDAIGYVGDLASISGLGQLHKYVAEASDAAAVRDFLDEGYSPITDELIDGFRILRPEDPEIATTIDNLVQMLARCDTIAIISDGTDVECPELTIHRGTREIGGSCIELCSNSGTTRVIFDIGLPLVNRDMSPFDWRSHRKLTLSQLLEKGILPSIDGLYDNDEPTVSAVVLSHAHLDHYGLLQFVHPDIPIHMSVGTRALVEVSNVFLDARARLDRAKTFHMGKMLSIGEFAITPYLMDHSAPDAAAFLIEADGQRIFYTGDFRGHGRKGVLLDRLVRNPPKHISYLIIEGSMLGRGEGRFPDESSVERELHDTVLSHSGLCYVFASSQNLDRIVSVHRAVRRGGKTLVVDLYTALVLDRLSAVSKRIPQFNWGGIRVLYSYYHAQKLAGLDRSLLFKYRKAKIEFDEISANPDDKVLLAKDSRYFRNLIKKLRGSESARAVFSLWHGYLERSDLRQFLESNGVPMVEVHTSGHAYVGQLKALVDAMKPRWIVPVHTFHPEEFGDVFPNVIQVEDGEQVSLC